MGIDGRAYMDGGVVNNAPVSYAMEFGADTVYVLRPVTPARSTLRRRPHLE